MLGPTPRVSKVIDTDPVDGAFVADTLDAVAPSTDMARVNVARLCTDAEASTDRARDNDASLWPCALRMVKADDDVHTLAVDADPPTRDRTESTANKLPPSANSVIDTDPVVARLAATEVLACGARSIVT